MKVLTEKEFGHSEVLLRENIIEHDGTYWKEIRNKLFLPVHPLKEFTSFPPSSFKTPFRLFVSKEKANTRYSVMEISTPSAFDISNLSSNVRSKVRRGVKRVEVKEFLYTDIQSREAFSVYVSFYHRSSWGNPEKLEYTRFNDWFKMLFEGDRLTLGGFVDNKLVGFLRGHLLEDTAYISFIATHTDYLNLYPNESLIWHFIEKIKTVPEVSRIVYAVKSTKQTLNDFKAGMGFAEKSYPARFECIIPSLSNLFIKFIDNRF